jgi:hypothetical protein
MSGASGRFETNGCTIWSFGSHWTLAKRNKNGEIEYDDHMWRNPYSNTTRDHMESVQRDPRLYGRIVNIKQFPVTVRDDIVKAMVASCTALDTVDKFRRAVYGEVGYGVDAPIEQCFRLAKKEVAKHYRQQLVNARSHSNYHRRYYTKESIAALAAYYRESAVFFVNLMDEYKKRWFKKYGEKMPPIPTRRAPKQPPLVRRAVAGTVTKSPKRGILGWHFLPENRHVRFESNPRRVDVGTILDCPVENDEHGIRLCNYGLHASRQMSDARGYYDGGWLCRTLQWGHVEEGHDKVAAEFRQCLGMIYLGSRYDHNLGQTGEDIRGAMQTSAYDRAEALALAAMGMTATQMTVSESQMANPPYKEESVA